MEQKQDEVYTQFLLACKEVMGLDLLRLENDEEYKTEFFNSINTDAEGKLSEITGMVNKELAQTETSS